MLLTNLPAFGQMHQKRLRGTIEDPLDEVRHHASDDFRTGLGGGVDIGALTRLFCQASLLLQDAQHRQYRRVCNLSVSEKLLIDFANGCAVALPDDLHDLQLEIRESDFSCLQGVTSVKVTKNLVVSRRKWQEKTWDRRLTNSGNSKSDE